MNNVSIGSSFDDFLEEEKIREEVESGAIKKLIAYQMQEKLKEEHLTKVELARRLETSHVAINRLLDPNNDSNTLSTLKKAASVLGKKIKLELI